MKMALPTISIPHYFLKLPSTEEEIKYRPFLVKEEKLLLIAMESEDEKQMVEAVKRIIKECTFDVVDVENLAMFDLEYIFLQLRAKSKGEELKLNFKCPKCEKENKILVDIAEVKVHKTPEHTNDVKIQDDIGIKMKYPSIQLAGKYSGQKTTSKQLFEMLNDSVDYIYDKETTYKTSDYTKTELTAFIDNLPDEVFTKIQEFFITMPKLKEEKQYKCNECEYTEDIVLEGLQNFLG